MSKAHETKAAGAPAKRIGRRSAADAEEAQRAVALFALERLVADRDAVAELARALGTRKQAIVRDLRGYLAGARTPAPAALLADGPEAPFTQVLADPTSKPQALAEAATRLAALALSRDPSKVGAGEDLKRQLEELRRTQQGWIELAEREGALVPRTALRTLGALLARRLVNVAERVSTQLPTRLEEWLGDDVFLAATTEERARRIREWWQAFARVLRADEGDFDKVVSEEQEAAR